MRVLMVTHTYPRHPDDAVAPFLAELVDALLERGEAVDVVLPFHPDLRQPERAGLRFLPYRYPLDSTRPWGYGETLKAGMRLRRSSSLALPMVALALRRHVRALLGRGGYDVLHAHWIVPNGAVVAAVARAAGVPFVVTLHGTDVSIAERSLPARLAAGRALRSASAVAAVSGHLRRRALAIGSPADRTSVVWNGVQLGRFSPDVAASGVRERFGVAPDSFLVLGVGRLIEAKGFGTLIEAVGRIDGLHVLLAGDGPLRGRLEQEAAGGRARVTFAGSVERDLLPRLFAAADVVVVPSVVASGQADGGPVTVLEALAAGKPLVATRIGVAADVVEDGVNGLVVEQGDAAALAESLSRLVRDAAARDRLGTAARRTALEQLGWERAADAYRELYARAVETARVSPRVRSG